MNDSIESIKERIKNKRNYSITRPEKDSKVSNKRLKYFRHLFSRTMIAIIFILVSIIYTKYSTTNLLMYKKYILNDVWSFSKINSFYTKYLGGVLPFNNILKDNSKPVFNEKLVFKNSENFKDGIALEVGTSYLIPAINSGIVVFIGEKEGYGQSVIIQGVDGVDIWYGNISHNNLKLYDYIEKGRLVGETLQENLYLVLFKDGNYLNYEEYSI